MFVQLEAEAFYPAGPEGGKGRGDVLLGEGFEEILLLLLGRFQSAQPPQSPQTPPEPFTSTPLPLVSPDPLREPLNMKPPPEQNADLPEALPPEKEPSVRGTTVFLPSFPERTELEPGGNPGEEPSDEALPSFGERKPPESNHEKPPALSRFAPLELQEPPDPRQERSAPAVVKGEVGAEGSRPRPAPEELIPVQRSPESERETLKKTSGKPEERSAGDTLQKEELPPVPDKKHVRGEPLQLRDPPANRPPAYAARRPAERDPAPPGGERTLPADPPSFEREPLRPEPRGEVAVSSRTLPEPGQPRLPERGLPEEQSLLRREPAPLQSFHAEELPEAENLTVERREIPHLPKQEVRRIDLRFESAHLRFMLQNENLSVEVSLKERIESHLTYMDAQRLYRNLQTLGVNLEVLRVNGVDLLSRSWKAGRREDRERGNIGEDGNPYPKADRGAPDSADFNLLL